MTEEEKDESFEIISVKEKYLRQQVANAEGQKIAAEFGVLVNTELLKIAEAELKKEAAKNAR